MKEERSNAIETVKNTYKEHNLCYIDIDRFKKIVKIYGNIGGEALLTQLMNILQEYFDRKDAIAHLGKDRIGLLYQITLFLLHIIKTDILGTGKIS